MESVHLASQLSLLTLDSLSHQVLKTMSKASGPFTRRLYTHRWRAFKNCCTSKGQDSVNCPFSGVLSFLQEFRMTAICPLCSSVCSCHISILSDIDRLSVWRNNLVIRFLWGARQLNPPSSINYPHTGPRFGKKKKEKKCSAPSGRNSTCASQK